ncbi:MAG: lytic transglycosylase domain-containing protein, partial [Bdellovibrionales bacterium]
KKGNLSREALVSIIDKVEAQPKWLLFGPSVHLLKISYVSALLALAELQAKSDRTNAWKTVNKLQQIRSWLTPEERANTYRWAGELAFVEQNLQAAQEFLMRSLSEKENAELRVRVESIRSTLLGAKKPSTVEKQSVAANEELGITDDEKEVFNRMTRSIESQDYVSATEDGVELIQKFPGSRRASEASDRILDIYLSVSNRTDEKFRHVHESLVREMLKVDATRLARWANNAYSRQDYVDSLTMSEKAYTKFGGQPDSTKMLLLAGKSAMATGEYTDASRHFERLLKQSSGTPEAVDSTFRLGLINFRAKKYSQAAAFFERLLALSGSKDYEYRALYWQWRAQQKIDGAKSATFAQPLIDKYPLSYYGLRAKAELNGNTLEISNKPVVIKTEYRLLETERLAWERLTMLLKAGWFKEAEKELESLPEAQSTEERLIRTKLWASTLRYDLAVQNVNKAMDESPELQQTSVLKIVFPHEYGPWITRESKALGLNEDWIRSLIRQESTFRPDAKSTSNALGVMQLLPATAQEMVKDFKIKDFQVPESLYDPDLNIKLGSNYLSRMVKNFNGNMPLALAAYNAGPTRLRRWLTARKDASPLEAANSSAPEVELWIDELPWDETSFYVKAILRNWLIYRLLDGSKVALTEPI